MVRLAFIIHFNRTWLGGINVILDLIYRINNYKNIKIIIITNSKKNLGEFKLSNKIEVIEDKDFFSFTILQRIIDKLLIIFIGKTFFLEKLLLRYKINYISHSTIITGKNSSVKSLVWITDFQFLHFPNFFKLSYKLLRIINLFLYKKHAYKILLSSNDAKKDLKKICNISSSKILVIKFKFNVPKINKLKKFSFIKKKYFLKKNFFYLPNQYWIHKNHKVIINALNRIKKSKKDIFIYSTGSKKDYRNPNNFQNIFELVKKYNLQKNYIYLGVIPFIDVMSLMYYSKAVINPSYFEGWSSTVEQANSYKKKIVLSNINVHKEQKPRYSYYFAPNNYIKLSKILIKINSERKRITSPKKKIKNFFQNNNYEKKFVNLLYDV